MKPSSSTEHLIHHFLAVPNCLESNAIAITKIGSDHIIASLNNKEQELSIFPEKGITNSTLEEAKLQSEKDTWKLKPIRQSIGEIQAQKKKTHTFKILRGDSSFTLKPSSSKRNFFELWKDGPDGTMVCGIKIESAHAWSYRISCSDDSDIALPLFCFWIVAMSRPRPSCDNQKRRSKSTRRVFDFMPGLRDRNHMLMPTVC